MPAGTTCNEANPSNKEITMLNPFHLSSRAAGACALALALLAPAHAVPVLEMSTANSATGIDLTVSVRDAVDLYGYQFTLNFDPVLLTGGGGTQGAVLSNARPTHLSP